jgi:hypothetical protein
MPHYEVEIVKVTRAKVRVEAASAAEIKRRIADVADSFADDLFHDAREYTDDFRIQAVRPSTTAAASGDA